MSAEDRVVCWKRRARDAERVQGYIEAEMESQRRWMTGCFDEERRLRDRCTHLYGMLRAHGLTDEQIDRPLPDGTEYVLTLVEASRVAAIMDQTIEDD